jgi:hypothetical protein
MTPVFVGLLGMVTMRAVCRCPAAGPRASRGAEAVTDAIDPNPDLSPTPETPIGDVAGVGDRMGDLSMA